MVFEAKEMYLECNRDDDRKPSLRHDRERSRCCENIAVKLAVAGYTMSFYVAGMNRAVDKAMWESMRRRAWDVQYVRGSFPPPIPSMGPPPALDRFGLFPIDYQACAQITNPPEHPEIAWKEGAVVGEESHLADGQDPTYHFRMVESFLRCKSLCYKAPSTIPVV
ncbi:Hypothetical predicted protein [Paramuricea clavata]|uniref:Uncharacterized protein n=1 Tax=Paramuricea clavata TaxID=317549 RepID=A0A7D9EIY1_PARCT|nr:Hypothetical predicted protein [Paramuricea clavata]